MVIDVESSTNSLNQSGCDWSVPSGMSGGSFSFNQKIKALTTLQSCWTSQLCVSLCVSVFYYFAVFDLESSVCICTVMSLWFLFKVPKCTFYALLMLLYSHYINAPWRRPFAWKFSWFMTGFYSIFYNRPAHFCRGLVVAVVMPQYSAVTQLQRAFCSHVPSQKHRVTSLASSGSGGPAGFFLFSTCVFPVPPPSPCSVHLLSFFCWAFGLEIYKCCCKKKKKT